MFESPDDLFDDSLFRWWAIIDSRGLTIAVTTEIFVNKVIHTYPEKTYTIK